MLESGQSSAIPRPGVRVWAGPAPRRATTRWLPHRATALSLPLRLGLVVAAAVIFSSLAAPPLYEALDRADLGEFPFRRLLRRLAELAAAIGLVVAFRRPGAGAFSHIGLRTAPAAWPDAARAALGSAALTAAVLAFEFGLGHRQAAGTATAELVLGSAISALLVGLVAQLCCSGLLLFGDGPRRGPARVAAGSSVGAFFATAHFLRGGRDPATVDWLAGWRLWAEVPQGLLQYREAWVGLFTLGLTLYLLAARQGHPWGAVGAHAGAVAVLQIVGELSDVPAGAEQTFLVDGLLPGYGSAALLLPGILWLAARPARLPVPVAET